MNKLIEAALSCDLEEIKSLVENGTDVHTRGDFALRWVSRHGHLEIVKYLIENGADIHAENDFSLRWAAFNGHLEIVKYLVENGADIHAKNDGSLRWAERCHVKIVKYLKSVYIERYQEKFICFNCLVLPCCTKLCSDKLVKK